MGFVNKNTGTLDSYQWNWESEETLTQKKKAFHIETKEDIARNNTKTFSKQAIKTVDSYISPELKAGNQAIIRKSNIKSIRKIDKSKKPIDKKYRNLKFCEANMIMYLNSLELDMFNPDNEFINNKLGTSNPTDIDLINEYNDIVDNYNKKGFDPTTQDYTDGNGNSFQHDIKTISDSKSSPVFPTQEQYVSAHKPTGRKASFNRIINKRGINNG